MTGIELLAQARTHAPTAKFLLLTAYADTEVAIQAINDIGLDHYLLKPWDPPEERLYPVIDDLLGDWRSENPDHGVDVRVVGHRWSERSYEIKTFLARNHVPYRWHDVESDDEGRRLAELAAAAPDDLPLVLVPDAEPMRSPATRDLADRLGLRTRPEQPLYDVCIVGGGPAGLAAAVYAASEGLSTVVVEREAPGGQAGTSASIENYLGFPKGLSGADLTHRAIAQVSRFGAELVLARDVVGFEQRGPVRAVLLGGSGEIEARSVVVASGVAYRKLAADGLADLTGRGVYYGADASDAAPGRRRRRLHRRRRQLRRAGGPQPGPARQAGGDGGAGREPGRDDVALPDRPHRGVADDLGALRDRGGRGARRRPPGVADARRTGPRAAATRCRPPGCSSSSAPRRTPTGSAGRSPATPRASWSPGPRRARPRVRRGRWSGRRTSSRPACPGVFAAGDVRRDSMKRVASAVGEGAMAVHLVHRYLATI